MNTSRYDVSRKKKHRGTKYNGKGGIMWTFN